MHNFHLTIRTPEKEAFSGEVESFNFDDEDGRMQVLAHHASITATMKFSLLQIKHGNQDEEFIARSGIFLFDNRANTATLLCLTCDLKSEIDHVTAREYLAFITEKLLKKESLSEYHVKYLEGEKFAIERQVKMTK